MLFCVLTYKVFLWHKGFFRLGKLKRQFQSYNLIINSSIFDTEGIFATLNISVVINSIRCIDLHDNIIITI